MEYSFRTRGGIYNYIDYAVFVSYKIYDNWLFAVSYNDKKFHYIENRPLKPSLIIFWNFIIIVSHRDTSLVGPYKTTPGIKEFGWRLIWEY